MKKENIYIRVYTQEETDTLVRILTSHGERIGAIYSGPCTIVYEDGMWRHTPYHVANKKEITVYNDLYKILKKPTYTATETVCALIGIVAILLGVSINQPILFPVGLISIFSAEIIRQVRLK